jgi:hypothetical protein
MEVDMYDLMGVNMVKGWVKERVNVLKVVKEDKVMKKDVMGLRYYMVKEEELGLDKLEVLLKDKGDVWNKKVRDWSWSIGKVEELGREKWLERMILCVSLMFNFWEDRGYGVLKSESVWEWGKKGCNESVLFGDVWNLKDVRYKIVKEVKRLLNDYKKKYGSLEEVCKSSNMFWRRLNWVWNLGREDVVGKKIVLVKMIMEDMGFKVYRGEEWGEGCVDYNVMVMLNYLGIKEIRGGVWNKKELDDIRVWVNGWCKKVCEVKGIDGSVLDGVLFMCGRQLRSELGNNDLVPMVLGEVNY